MSTREEIAQQLVSIHLGLARLDAQDEEVHHCIWQSFLKVARTLDDCIWHYCQDEDGGPSEAYLVEELD